MRNPDVCVVGLGYVGLPLAVAFAEVGVDVVGYDVDESKVVRMQSGQSPVEDIADAQLGAALAQHLQITASLPEIKAASSYIICVPTPLRESMPDLAFVESAARAVGKVLESGDLVVLESTTYPGTTRDFLAPLLEEESGLSADTDFDLAYSPERIDPGNTTWTIATTPKVVGGCTERATERAVLLYSRVANAVVRAAGPSEAEMAKLLENTFRHVNIALVNELAVFCQSLGIDIWEVIRLASTKPFGFMPFHPGPGVGGHCIPVDPSYLSWALRRHGFQFRFVELAQEINARMPSYVATRTGEILNGVGLAISRARILCIGAAYKPGVADCRESPALDVMRHLAAKGADLRFHDPYVDRVEINGATLVSTPLDDESVADCDLVIVLTAHPDIDWDKLASRAPRVLDTRNALPDRRDNVHGL
ncbi:MAG TPA: nucleotide sugar dehydrogenase [Mycobacteriales bacterium]|jgi:nucleotide sugar dehydrogenase|nr:nucleotide sugar dehydrogenase [Mycobacteriales bacterium]